MADEGKQSTGDKWAWVNDIGEEDNSKRPIPESFGSWPDYWKAQGMPWRTEPEIDEERQRYLAQRRAVKPDIEQGIYPFRDDNSSIKLTRADIEWLLATHESGGKFGPVDWQDAREYEREGLDLRGANLVETNLSGLPLAYMRGGLDIFESLSANPEERPKQIATAAAQLTSSNLIQAQLQRAKLIGVRLENSLLERAQLESAILVDAHLEAANLESTNMERANLDGAHLEGAFLLNTHLESSHLARAHLEAAGLAMAHLEGALLIGAHLEGALIVSAHLEGAILMGAHLEGAELIKSHLEGAVLSGAILTASEVAGVGLGEFAEAYFQAVGLQRDDTIGAHLEGKQMLPEDLERIRAWKEDFPEILQPAHLWSVFFDSATDLTNAILGDEKFGFVSVANVHWGEANLSSVRWQQVQMLGDERVARDHRFSTGELKSKAKQLEDFEAAVRANRQLAIALRGQGMNVDADRFSYRAQVCERQVLRRQGHYGRALGSWFLDLISGYGYKPIRSVITYLLVIFSFAAAYYLLGNNVSPALDVHGAIVFSLTSFHGRGFAPGGSLSPDNLLTTLAAIEAVIGLLIEITFIATFTQRFFAR